MSQLNLPSISVKKAAVIIGVLVLITLVLNSVGGGRYSLLPTLRLSGGGVASYGAPTKGIAPAYDTAQGNYGEKATLYRGESGSDGYTISPMPPVPGPDAAPAGEEKIIKSASLALLVENVDNAAKEINLIRTRLGGQVGNSTFNEYTTGSRMGDITIWVPSAKFDEAIAEIKKLALRVNNESTNVSDVSAQFVDLDARLKNLRATEKQYLEILTRSGKLSDVLEVTRELSNTRAQIEQLEGQRNYLSRQVALSSIHISLTQEASPADLTNEWRPLAVIKAAAKKALSDLTDFIDAMLAILVALPLLLLKLALLGIICWLLWRGGHMVYRRVERDLPPPTGRV